MSKNVKYIDTLLNENSVDLTIVIKIRIEICQFNSVTYV